MLRTSSKLAILRREEKTAIFECKKKLVGYVAMMLMFGAFILCDLVFARAFFFSQSLTFYGITSMYFLEFLRDSVKDAGSRTEKQTDEPSSPSSVPMSGVSVKTVDSLHQSQISSSLM